MVPENHERGKRMGSVRSEISSFMEPTMSFTMDDKF
jgi:hypothetical protein